MTSLKVYQVSFDSTIRFQKVNKHQFSSILKECEGDTGTLYLKNVKDQPLYPQCVARKTKILEVKNLSIKIRTHGTEISRQMVYIEHILGFLKEVD